MKAPLLTPPACIALGMSLALHVVLAGYGWGALNPDASTRPAGIPLPAFAIQVRMIAPVSTPGNPLALVRSGTIDVVSPAAGARAASLPGHEQAGSAGQAQSNAIAGMLATVAATREAAIFMAATATQEDETAHQLVDNEATHQSEEPAGRDGSDVAARSANQALPILESEPGPTEPANQGTAALAAQGPAPRPDAAQLLTPPPVPPELTGAAKPPTTPEQALLDATYYPTRQLTLRPEPGSDPILKLPPNWLEAFGRSILTIYVNADGSVEQVILRNTTLPPELHQNVIDAFRLLTFKPGEIDGRRVPSYMSIEANVSMLLGRH